MTSEAPERTVAPSWTPRQRQVLDLLARGYTNGQIGEALGISLDGAKWHVSEVMGKLGVDSREAAAAYWREYNGLGPRLARVFRGLFVSSGLRWAAGVAGVAVAVAAGAVLVLALGGDDDQQATPDATPQATSTAEANSTPAPTPLPGWTSANVQVLARGESVQGDYGLLYLDPTTGGGRFWPLPFGSFVDVPSPSGRWVIWGVRASTSQPLTLHLLDTETNATRPIELDGVPATNFEGYSPDESQMVVFAGARAAVVQTHTGRIVTELPGFQPMTAGWGGFTAMARWSSDGSRVAVLLGPSIAIVDVPQDRVEQLSFPAWNLQWSRNGLRLALTGPDGTLIRDVATGAETKLVVPGVNPRWSPDDSYLAVVASGDEPSFAYGHARVFDTASGKEVLRVIGYPFCIGDYWRADSSLPFTEGKAVAVPGGELFDVPISFVPPGRYHTGGTPDAVQALEGDRAVAEVRIATSWAMPVDLDGVGYYNPNAPPAIIVGLGGKGTCTVSEKYEVQKPPF